MRKNLIILFLSVILLLPSTVFAAGVTDDSRWISIKDNNELAVLIDSKTLSSAYRSDKKSNQMISYWAKFIPKSAKAKKEIRQHLRNDYPSLKVNSNRISYTLWSCYLDIQNKEAAKALIVYYDNNGKEIFREKTMIHWDPIFPESLEEDLYKAVKVQLEKSQPDNS